MFLLNEEAHNEAVCYFLFTIQNVSIKSKRAKEFMGSCKYLQYKMFLLNRE